VLERAAFPSDSHNEKALKEILESYPRDELFQIAVDELFETAMGILHLGERQRLRLFIRADKFCSSPKAPATIRSRHASFTKEM